MKTAYLLACVAAGPCREAAANLPALLWGKGDIPIFGHLVSARYHLAENQNVPFFVGKEFSPLRREKAVHKLPEARQSQEKDFPVDRHVAA